MDMCGFTAAEVAAIIVAPRGTVLARVHRGRKRLAEAVQGVRPHASRSRTDRRGVPGGCARRDPPATIYSCADGKGRRILVIASPRTFPRSPSARDVEPAPNWLASVNGASLLCADREGLSWLAVAGDDATALAAGRVLGLG